MTILQKLPIGLQTFSRIREDNFVYIDKTPMIAEMVDGAGRLFLSRPRRFGKSLLVDTLKCLFEGRKELFDGLYIADRWDWNKTSPVIRFDFANGNVRSPKDLEDWLHQQIDENLQRQEITAEYHQNPSIRFTRTLQAIAKQSRHKAVVVLIDEYDKPILDNIDQPAVAAEVREALKNFYSVLKGQDAHIRFLFMTGVTKFGKVSLFSGIIEDITLDAKYATICGYTQNDLEDRFGEHLKGVDWQQLKEWYNGYSFLGEPVYNPYDILLFISKGLLYRNYWFETGSPSFLIKLFQQKNYFLPELENIEVGEDILASFEIEAINPTTLLFQAGYLTIKDSITDFAGQPSFVLKLPNQEVRQSLSRHLADVYTQQTPEARSKIQHNLYNALRSGNLEQLQTHITTLFAGIPWCNFTNNQLAESEGYYASVLYAFFASLNATIIPEDISNHGQADLTVILGGYIYVIEIKRNTDKEYKPQEPNSGLQQIQLKQYSQKYRNQEKQLYEVGMIFNTHQRNLVQMDWVQMK